MKQIFEITKSICPYCKKELDAKIIEEAGSIFMEKQCEEHGFFKNLVSKYSWYYKGLNSFYNLLFPKGHNLRDKTIKILQFYPTLKCNLACNICFSYSETNNKQEDDLSLEEIRKMAKLISGKKKISFLGGEPTLRSDLPEIIKIFSQSGHRVWLYTNGLKLTEPKYVNDLRKSNVNYVWISIESLRDDEVYLKIRGDRLINIKQQALNNLKLSKINTGIIQVVVKSINETEIGDIVTYAKKNNFITSLCIRGYSDIGKKKFSLSGEFAMDELIEAVEKQTKGLVTLEEFFIFQKLTYIFRSLFSNHPQCYVCQYLYIPRKDKKRIREIFPSKEFNRYLIDFEEIYIKSPAKAKVFFIKKIFKKMVTYPPFFFQVAFDKFVNDFRFNNDYLLLEAAMFYTPFSIDLKKTQTRCTDALLPDYLNGKITDLCTKVCGLPV
jgi:7,8-dihydro-6-hydroxymethylpterin dimethyltransferase